MMGRAVGSLWEILCTQPPRRFAATRTNAPRSLGDTSVHVITPSIRFRAGLCFWLFVTDTINQKGGHTYFSINLMAYTVAQQKCWDPGTYLQKVENQTKWVSWTHCHSDALLLVTCANTQTWSLFGLQQVTFIVTINPRFEKIRFLAVVLRKPFACF